LAKETEKCKDILVYPVERNILERLMLTAEEKEYLKLCTRQQAECDKWHDARHLRITGSQENAGSELYQTHGLLIHQ